MSKLEKIALPDYTRKEDWLNSISHMVGGGLSIIATLLCLFRAYQARSWAFAAVAVLYGFCMVAMYSCSSVYHALRPNNGKRAMRKVDHAMIFPMIAGTITPYARFVIMPVNKTFGLIILIVAWVVVAAAIPLTIVIFNQTKVVQMILYLALGWMVIFSIKILWTCFDRTGFWLLLSGGIAYTLGAILYGIGAKKRYFHSVFHFFVLLGSILHFFSLFFFVFVK